MAQVTVPILDSAESEVPPLLAYVRYPGKTGQHLLAVSFSQFAPTRISKRSR